MNPYTQDLDAEKTFNICDNGQPVSNGSDRKKSSLEVKIQKFRVFKVYFNVDQSGASTSY